MDESSDDTLEADPETEASSDTADAITSSPVDIARATLNPEHERYEHVRMLGQGGMGVVALRSDRRIGRDVALKTLRPQLQDDQRAVQRFLREARIQGQLEHPAIVPIYDLGQTADGTLYFSMKRVKGRTLREILGDRRVGRESAHERLGLRRLLSAFGQVCQAVEFAHSRGVIHRDLKPDNIMFGEHGEVYVLDWGIARLLGPVDADDANNTEADAAESAGPTPIVDVDTGAGATRQGAVIGTLGYMSPEQAAGLHDQIDARSDVWSLGAILYELLCLRPLIARASLAEMLGATALGVDADPSAVNPDVPPELARVCIAATAGDPKARLSSARAVSDAIESYLDGDRDARARRDKAQEYAQAAAQAAMQAFETGDVEQRRAAAQASGQALALDPNNTDARRTLLELFTKPPKVMPEVARATLDAERSSTLVSFYRESIVAISIYFPVMFSLVWFIERDQLWVIVAALASSAGYLGTCIYGIRRPRPNTYVPLILHGFVCLAMLMLTRLFTPLLMLPVLCAMNTMITSSYPGSAPRWSYAVVGMTPVLIAGALELLGVWTPTMVWAGETLHLHSELLELGDSALYIPVLLLGSVVPIVVGTTLNGRVQRLAEAAAREAHVQRWQLEQLVPAHDNA